MPGFRPRRDPLLRLASSVGRRAAVGTGSVGVAGVRRAADVSGNGGGALGIMGELHQIDTFSITDDATDEFTLTMDPVQDSWNPSLNGVMLEEGVDYTISGDVLTVLDPTDLFLGADDQGTPWQLRVQYDYLVGMPATPTAPATIGTLASAAGGNGEATATFGVAPAAGATVVVAFVQEFSEPAAMSGLGASWTMLSECSGGHHRLWLGTGCDGVSTAVNGGAFDSGNDVRAYAVIVDGLSSSGILSSDSESAVGTIGPLTAPSGGGTAFAVSRDAGTAELPSAWTTLATSGSTPFLTFAYVALSGGQAAQKTDASAHYAMALIPNE